MDDIQAACCNAASASNTVGGVNNQQDFVSFKLMTEALSSSSSSSVGYPLLKQKSLGELYTYAA